MCNDFELDHIILETKGEEYRNRNTCQSSTFLAITSQKFIKEVNLRTK